MRDLQLRFLDVFLREWALYRMKGADEPVESGNNAILEVPFDAEVHSGEIRVFADGERPLTGLALLKQGEDGWLVVPVSEFTVPATEQEILVGSRVYQLWNAFTASPDFASRSWIVEALPVEDIRLLAAAMAGVLAGEALSGEFAELVGCPIVMTDDLRLDYEREFARQPKKIEMRLVAPVAEPASGWLTWRRSLMGMAASFAILLGTVVAIMREPPQPSLEARKRLAEVAAVHVPPASVDSEPVAEPPPPAVVSESVVEPSAPVAGEPAFKPLPELPPIVSEAFPEPSPVISEPVPEPPAPVVASEPVVEPPVPAPVAVSEPVVEPPAPAPVAVSEPVVEPPVPAPVAVSEPVVEPPVPAPVAVSEPVVEPPAPVPVAVSEPVVEPPVPAPVAVSEPVVEPPPPLVERSQAAADAAVVVSKCAAETIGDRPKVLRERSYAKRASGARKSAERAREMQSRSRMERYAECSKSERAMSMSDALCCDADAFDDDGGSEVGVQQAYDNKKKMSRLFDDDGGSEVGVRQAYDSKKKMSRLFDGGEIGTSSYELVHRFLTRYRRLPPREMVRLDEVVNHFDYACSGPTGDVPVTVSCELAACPWNRERMLLCVGVQAKKAAVQDVEILFSFNEARVRSHRLLGYGYGKLTAKDLWPVGRIGRGDTRVSLHELVLTDDGASSNTELLTVGLTYRDSATASSESRKVAVQAVAITRKDGPSDDFRFASAVAEFVELLRGSANKDAYTTLLRRVRSGKGEDGASRWDELIELVESAAKATDLIRHKESAPTGEAAADDHF